VGATVVSAPRDVVLDADALGALLRDERVSVACVPPALLALVDESLPRQLRAVMVAGEPFPAELANRWSPGRQFHNGYGPTEATVTCVDYLCPPQPLTGPVPIGRVMPNQRAYVLDAQLRLVPVGVVGQLFIAGAGLAHGYLGRAELTAARFLPDPFAPTPGQRMYATGDLVRWRADGNLEFLGRADRQVKIRGLRIELGEIEHVLAGQPGVRGCAVVVKQPGTAQARLVGYVVPDPGTSLSPDATRQALAEQLPLHMVPTDLVVLDELPLTGNGKLDHARLPDPQATTAEQTAPLTSQTQHQLAQIWQELLNLTTPLGAQDNFFNLGGNSLQITQLIARIQEHFGIMLHPREVFANPVLAQLAHQVDVVRQPMIDQEIARLEAEIAGVPLELDKLPGGAS
jgi:acyl-coenzyme A synthetase/AMP-(fatty) acid ligase/acyl carrier protein